MLNDKIKKTPFTDIHHHLGARMREFAGYDMPIEYSGIMNEHRSVTSHVGVFDVSHMGEFWIKGSFSKSFVQKMTSNDVSLLSVGKVQYSCFPNESGGIIDDLLVYRYAQEEYLLVVNASNIEKDWNWCVKNNSEGARLENASDDIAQLAVQGFYALKTLQKLTDVDLATVPYYSFIVGKIADIEGVIISNTGYTGVGGFELYFKPKDAKQIWEAIFNAGNEFEIKPIGLGARDTLRLEAGFPLYGHELTDMTSPLEAGLDWITRFTEGNQFISRPLLEMQKAKGITRRLVGFEILGKGIARHGHGVFNKEGKTIGQITSGTVSPITRKGIALGYIQTEYATIGTSVRICIRDKEVEAVVVKPPFRRKNC